MPGLESDVGWVHDTEDGLAYVDLPAGYSGRVTLRYVPGDMPFSVGTTFLGIAACVAVWRFARRRTDRAGDAHTR
jgi:hypothetical protein